jgi:CheY-like chemotaxis protein
MQSGKFTITPEKTNLKEKIEQTKALFFKEAEAKSLKYTLQFSENFPQYVIVDETRIAQIVSNFISNAIKFTPENKSVNIDVTYDTVTQKLKVLVEDTGIGIDEKAQAKIFNSFEQEDASVTRKYGGTGLGLAISKQLVSLMQGELIFKSIKDVGSTFGFEIPAEVGKEDDANKEESSVPEVEYTGKVLIAEDNAMNTILMETFMEAFGIAFDIVENGALAVEAVKEEEYALVLMDNQMPVLSGIEATMQIRAFNTTLPIVALSANAIKTEQEKFLEVGMNDTLAKPVDYYDLKAIFDKYLG